jgi:hypothetical protein
MQKYISVAIRYKCIGRGRFQLVSETRLRPQNAHLEGARGQDRLINDNDDGDSFSGAEIPSDMDSGSLEVRTDADDDSFTSAAIPSDMDSGNPRRAER